MLKAGTHLETKSQDIVHRAVGIKCRYILSRVNLYGARTYRNHYVISLCAFNLCLNNLMALKTKNRKPKWYWRQ